MWVTQRSMAPLQPEASPISKRKPNWKHAYDNARFNEAQSHRPHRDADDETRVFVGEHGTESLGPARNSGYHEATGGARTLDAPTNSFHLLFGARRSFRRPRRSRNAQYDALCWVFPKSSKREGCQMSLFPRPKKNSANGIYKSHACRAIEVRQKLRALRHEL